MWLTYLWGSLYFKYLNNFKGVKGSSVIIIIIIMAIIVNCPKIYAHNTTFYESIIFFQRELWKKRETSGWVVKVWNGKIAFWGTNSSSYLKNQRFLPSYYNYLGT